MSTVTTIAKGNVTAQISSMGAELTSFVVDDREYLWQADPTFWGKHAPVLFPIVGSIRGGEQRAQRAPAAWNATASPAPRSTPSSAWLRMGLR